MAAISLTHRTLYLLLQLASAIFTGEEVSNFSFCWFFWGVFSCQSVHDSSVPFEAEATTLFTDSSGLHSMQNALHGDAQLGHSAARAGPADNNLTGEAVWSENGPIRGEN